MFGFTKTISSPLTKLCTRLDDNLVNGVTADRLLRDVQIRGGSEHKRAAILSLLIMAASGHFVSKSLPWDKGGWWEGSRRYLRGTNLDVITAEASVWIAFLMFQFRRHENREMRERIGYVSFPRAAQMTLMTIKSETGIDFTAREIESRKLYFEALKDDALSEAFASVVFRSLGCKSLAEPLKPSGPQYMLAPEWTPISLHVGIFFKTIPQGYYDTFKNIMLHEASDHFPPDEGWDEAD